MFSTVVAAMDETDSSDTDFRPSDVEDEGDNMAPNNVGDTDESPSKSPKKSKKGKASFPKKKKEPKWKKLYLGVHYEVVSDEEDFSFIEQPLSSTESEKEEVLPLKKRGRPKKLTKKIPKGETSTTSNSTPTATAVLPQSDQRVPSVDIPKGDVYSNGSAAAAPIDAKVDSVPAPQTASVQPAAVSEGSSQPSSSSTVKRKVPVSENGTEPLATTSTAKKPKKGRKKAQTTSSLASALASLKGDAKQVSTLEKSRQNWSQFKDKEGLTEDLAEAAKGGYLEKKDFLERVDQRQFEAEKAVRAVERNRRDLQK